MKRFFFTLILFLIGAQTLFSDNSSRFEWWNEARFGMFIHWGLYSVAAGEWQGQQVDGIGEWIQNFAKVPNSEYEKLAKDFSLKNYNPEEWVLLAKNAGARYIVFTAKHHDGFTLYPSDVSDYDIERTPYKGDPLKELTDACRKHDIKVGFYYSHRQDWREEAAAVMKNEYDGHYGKPKAEVKPNLDKYIHEKALPQMKELLTRYGKVDLLWYDTPFDLSKEQSQLFVDIVRKLQPDCLINGRVGFNLGDYGHLGDNEMPCATAKTDLEMVATMNHTWGYKKNDQDWKGEKEILCSLIESVSRGINYMINIGPKEDGSVPQPSIDILQYMSTWMKTNAESIYGASANPFNDNFPWGYVTRKKEVLYLHLARSPKENQIKLKGLRSAPVAATLLATNTKLTASSESGSVLIDVPAGLDYEAIPVIKLTCAAPLQVDASNYESEGIISLPVASANKIAGQKGKIEIAEGGNTANFNPDTGKLELTCIIDTLGNYNINLVTSRHWRRGFLKDTYVNLSIGDLKIENHLLKEDGMYQNVRSNSYPESWSCVGTVYIKKKGKQVLTLAVEKLGTFSLLGFFGEDLQGESDDNLRLMRVELVLADE